MNPSLNLQFQETILKKTGASSFEVEDVLQELWSGYGHILRIRLNKNSTVIVKHIRMLETGNHPRGWNSNLSHQRKLKSYQVETAWYRQWSGRCGPDTRIPQLIAFDEYDGEILLVLEDLDASGYPARLTSISQASLKACLDWLANFHATFMGAKPDKLWLTGTYWHLETRSEELEALDDPGLKRAASALDQTLSKATFQTLVHGDAKLANFCFSNSGEQVAVVDFQYVGGGCGMKDLAYFIGSCLDESACEEREAELLDHYFFTLSSTLSVKHPELDHKAVEAEWRRLFPFAWTDFHRFLKGWSPGHWKINSYSERLAREVLASL
ncbi:aminoglycoside phosphotransferase family protein [Akkermansiaceae bacterium]|nr:aminoglycoside phosphotransferase family protein [Akkermansiaceae bacterium]